MEGTSCCLTELTRVFLLRYMFGPDQFCQGLSPGGGSSCINIPEGCYIEVPTDNSVPTVNCNMLVQELLAYFKTTTLTSAQSACAR